jgi:type II secretory pathway component GspD/PulD (secretin)
MKKISLALIALALPLAAVADQPTPAKAPVKVSVTAKGTDLHVVLADLFEQAKQQYVIAPNLHFALFLSLNNVDFERALQIVCDDANIQAELKGGVYFVHNAHKPTGMGKKAPIAAPTKMPAMAPAAPALTSAAATTKTPTVTPVKPVTTATPVTPTATVSVKTPIGPLKPAVLARKLTTRFSKTDIRDVFAEFGRQTHTTINVDPRVPNYKLDAYLLNTSLRYALNQVTKAAGLEWKLPDNHTIAIAPPDDGSHVEVVKG